MEESSSTFRASAISRAMMDAWRMSQTLCYSCHERLVDLIWFRIDDASRAEAIDRGLAGTNKLDNESGTVKTTHRLKAAFRRATLESVRVA